MEKMKVKELLYEMVHMIYIYVCYKHTKNGYCYKFEDYKQDLLDVIFEDSYILCKNNRKEK